MAYHEISPGTFTLMPATYTSVLSVQVSDFEDNCLLIQHDRLICDSCSSGQRFACGFLQPTPHDANLAVRLTLPPAGCIEDLHLQVSAPCRAHNKKGNQLYNTDSLGIVWRPQRDLNSCRRRERAILRVL